MLAMNRTFPAVSMLKAPSPLEFTAEGTFQPMEMLVLGKFAHQDKTTKKKKD